MNYNAINKVWIKTIALALGELNNKMVYVGGSVVCLYADDTAAEETRPTKDVDVFLEIATYGKLVKLQDQLATMGFYPERESGVMCRFKYKDILVDIMSTKKVGWAQADKWFELGLKTLLPYKIDEVTINILHISYFLATKFNTFHDRGEDARTSRHFEDIVYVLDNRQNLVSEILTSPDDVREYLVQEFTGLLKPEFAEATLGHLNYESQTERLSG